MYQGYSITSCSLVPSVTAFSQLCTCHLDHIQRFLLYHSTSLASLTSLLGQRSLRCLESEVLPAHCLVLYVMREAGVLIVAVVEDVCGLEIQAEGDARSGVAEVVVDVGVEPGVAPDHEAEYHEISRATSRLSEEHPVGRWLPVDDAS